MAGNTALSYQMMIEEKLLTAMMNAEQRGAIQMACGYAREYCRFLQVEEKDMPKKPLNNIDSRQFYPEWTGYYFNLMEAWGKKISENLIRVRKEYGGKNKDIPKMEGNK